MELYMQREWTPFPFLAQLIRPFKAIFQTAACPEGSSPSAVAARTEIAARLLDTYGNHILQLAYTYVLNFSDAEDILQGTLVQYLKTTPAFASAAHEKAWLLRTASNLSKNKIRYNRLRTTDEFNEELIAEEREDLSFVWEAVSHLPVTQREIMDKIEVTPDMRERILKNIEQQKTQKALRKYHAKTLQRWYPVAACVALLLCVALVLPRLLSPDAGTHPDSAISDSHFPGDEQTTIANGMETYGSAAALSAALGFPVDDLARLPFTPDSVSYLDCWGEYAQITYEAADASVTFRKIPGQEDISGDYNTYDIVTTHTIAGEEVTLKGDAEGYSLAIWSDDTYSYALSFTPQVAEETVTAIIQAIPAK